MSFTCPATACPFAAPFALFFVDFAMGLLGRHRATFRGRGRGRDLGSRNGGILHQRTAGLNREFKPRQPAVDNVMYSHMKRTTLQIDDALYARLRRRASDEGRTLTDVVERTLRAGLDAPRDRRAVRLELPSYDLGPFLADPARRDRWPAPGRPEEGEP